MLSIQRERRRFTPEEYLLLEETSHTRNEYCHGEIFAMTGGTLNHNQIVGNLYRALSSALEGGPWRVFQSDVRRLVQTHTLFTYPDLIVVCGPLPLMPGRQDTLTDARLLIEVLSISTESYDRTDKFRMYRALSSLKEYVLVAQDRVAVERHHRLAGGSWEWKEYLSLDDSLELGSLALSLPLSRIYSDLPLT
ncbi:MAG: Uma2 family endonuclease [Candidatus Eremiobacterota bacterium]